MQGISIFYTGVISHVNLDEGYRFLPFLATADHSFSLYPQVWVLLVAMNASNCLFTDRMLKDAEIIEMNFAFWINC